MSAKAESQTKKFGGSSRTIPHTSEKAQKWYPAEDVAQPRKVRRRGGSAKINILRFTVS